MGPVVGEDGRGTAASAGRAVPLPRRNHQRQGRALAAGGPAHVSSIAGQSAVKPGEQPARPRSRPPGEQRHQAPSRP